MKKSINSTEGRLLAYVSMLINFIAKFRKNVGMMLTIESRTTSVIVSGFEGLAFVVVVELTVDKFVAGHWSPMKPN